MTDSAQNLAQFVRTHEKALANALQLRRQAPRNGQASNGESPTPYQHSNSSSTSSTLAAALSLGTLNFSSHNMRPTTLSLTPHHLYYLLDRFEETGIPIGPMNVRLENIHTEASPANYVSFLGQSQRSRGRSDRDSVHSVSSVRSVMSGMSTLWAGFGLSSNTSAAKTEKAKAQMLLDLRYLYSAFTKIPCLQLCPDRKARLIEGYEEFPFDTAVPLLAFKNISALEVSDVDFRQFFGWDKMAEQLRSLTVKRANVDDPTDLLVNVVLDDMDKRRRRSSKAQSSPVLPWPASPSLRFSDLGRTYSTPPSPVVDAQLSHSPSPRNNHLFQPEPESPVSRKRPRTKSASPTRPTSSRQDGSYRQVRSNPGNNVKRSASGSSNSSSNSRSGSSSNLLTLGILPASKWRFLRHLSLADNSLTSMTGASLAPLSNNLHSLDLSSNLFTEMPDCLATLMALRALNLSNCMIESLHSLKGSPLPAITALNLRANRLVSIAGIERLLSLERLDLRDNKIQDPTELARLTGSPNIHDVYVLRNPFVKTHSNYRVTIFNLFRAAPGYYEDIVIDSSPPGYSERRQLRDRVVEPEKVPEPKDVPFEPVASLPPRIDTLESTWIGEQMEGVQRPQPQTTQSEFAVGSGRRRKGTRRRIVDLAQDPSPPIIHQRAPMDVPQEVIRPGLMSRFTDDISPKNNPSLLPPLYVHSEIPSPQQIQILDLPHRLPPDVSDRGRFLATEIQNLNLDGTLNPNAEDFRQKIEAFKNEVGSKWLSMVPELSGGQHVNVPTPNAQCNHVGLMRPESPFRASNQGIVSGSRTLG